jgi:hypothetical protein
MKSSSRRSLSGMRELDTRQRVVSPMRFPLRTSPACARELASGSELYASGASMQRRASYNSRELARADDPSFNA